MSEKEGILEVSGITKLYGAFSALSGVTFELHPGELVALLGPNGCGKSTLIKVIVGFEFESSGKITYDGKEWKGKAERVKYVGWAPQDDSFYGNLTLFENLVYFGALYEIPWGQAKRRAEELLKMLKLDHKRNEISKTLSGGMKRRLNMAVALMHDPKILILDEPEAGVDPVSRVTLWEVVEEVKKKGTTILLVTHNLIETEHLSDRFVIMKAGTVIFEDTPKRLRSQYRVKNIEDAFKKYVEEH
ncbi:ABC transporter ATP-binding protein [Candidatus Woesearchaeota archaeon]|nr:ABC transporter ATP-binding protein [Candidatus Woesearchaeota archaeon]